ncbi:urea ABC transporter ATP-binding subunit UrtE [Flammeovirga aprica]|uniref:Urea ABC transporter ATP-binding subunit UrtE n=1 Tax=Flammeovirga aprica JL-4 TaxID=694437 RepID=A0A7X9RYG6_9BACT|nr:urea ABC transporter ATP-binding subunit UrtE [Flammeovirga aprica]NME70999.1 urea ABC transporter ATP-binding subunit UrtE [Flammeovirga aprica JL-4]
MELVATENKITSYWNKLETHLKVSALETSYGESQVLWGTELEAKKGKVTTIMGRNGVGKTTTLKTIMGLLNVQSGAIEFEGKDISKLPSHKRAKAGIGYVPQGREIIPKLTVYENLLIGLDACTDRKAKIPEDEIYELFPILKDFRNRPGGNLSGGQQQQLAIARALCGRPSMLLLDEPTEGIQPSITQDIGDILKKLALEKGISVVLVEQKLDFALRISDYFYIMDRGKVIEQMEASTIDADRIRQHLSV